MLFSNQNKMSIKTFKLYIKMKCFVYLYKILTLLIGPNDWHKFLIAFANIIGSVSYTVCKSSISVKNSLVLFVFENVHFSATKVNQTNIYKIQIIILLC